MRVLLLLGIILIGFSISSCTHDAKPTDPVVTPTPTEPVPAPVTLEKIIVVHFHFDSSHLSSAQKKILKDALSTRKEGAQVLIVGHTDSQGSNKYNQRLSEKRAKAVSKYLKRLKIDSSWTAKGETDLLNADKTKADHKLNRRATVGFTVVVK